MQYINKIPIAGTPEIWGGKDTIYSIKKALLITFDNYYQKEEDSRPFTVRVLQLVPQPLSGIGIVALHQLFGCASENDIAAGIAALGAEVDNPIGTFDKLGVMLDHQDGVAMLDQTVEGFHQLVDVMEMEASGRLVEEEELALLVASRAAPHRPTMWTRAVPRPNTPTPRL